MLFEDKLSLRLFLNYPRREGNWAARQGQQLSRANLYPAATRCLTGPSGFLSRDFRGSVGLKNPWFFWWIFIAFFQEKQGKEGQGWSKIQSGHGSVWFGPTACACMDRAVPVFGSMVRLGKGFLDMSVELQPRPPLTGVSRALRARNPERVSKESISRGLPARGPKSVRNSLETDCFETLESQTVSRLFRTVFGPRGRKASGDSLETRERGNRASVIVF